MKQNCEIILASASPRRSQLMKEMDLVFRVEPTHVDESFDPSLQREAIAMHLSRIKAEAVPLEDEKADTVVVTADTIVLLEGEVLGKPADREEAISMLKRLEGKMHEVITGVTLRDRHRIETLYDLTRVYFRSLSEEEIADYVDRYQPYDKAGAYGVQEWIGHVAIRKVEGSYTNVMGLPTEKLYEALRLFCSTGQPA
ncbi:MAG: septum formation protein Maf [Flavobacteriales bacterium]|nr:septum formation protein Maf [Flavobacteriales bacterium]MCB9448909.1 septum formation protein Maf [Flavobacteriales bacterium]